MAGRLAVSEAGKPAAQTAALLVTAGTSARNRSRSHAAGSVAGLVTSSAPAGIRRLHFRLPLNPRPRREAKDNGALGR